MSLTLFQAVTRRAALRHGIVITDAQNGLRVARQAVFVATLEIHQIERATGVSRHSVAPRYRRCPKCDLLHAVNVMTCDGNGRWMFQLDLEHGPGGWREVIDDK